MSEYEIWSLTYSNGIGLSIGFAAMSFLLWVGFRLAKGAADTGANLISKTVVLIFNGCIYMGLLTNMAFGRFNFDNTAGQLSELQTGGGSLTTASQGFVLWRDVSGAPVFSLIPDLVPGIFVLSAALVVIFTLFIKKND